MTVLVKISGSELDDKAYLAQFAGGIRSMTQPVIIVHGGGKEISHMQRRMGIEPRYVDGVRITDAASLELTEMVLCGRINKRLVRTLLAARVNAVGISGVDGGMIQAKKMIMAKYPTLNMRYTGAVVEVRTHIVTVLLEAGFIPVIAPLGLSKKTNYNVNADHVAGALANAMQVERLIFLTNVPGVLDKDGSRIPELTTAQAEALIEEGIINKGMIPKVRTALSALEQGVSAVMIGTIDALAGVGTTFAR